MVVDAAGQEIEVGDLVFGAMGVDALVPMRVTEITRGGNLKYRTLRRTIGASRRGWIKPIGVIKVAQESEIYDSFFLSLL